MDRRAAARAVRIRRCCRLHVRVLVAADAELRAHDLLGHLRHVAARHEALRAVRQLDLERRVGRVASLRARRRRSVRRRVLLIAVDCNVLVGRAVGVDVGVRGAARVVVRLRASIGVGLRAVGAVVAARDVAGRTSVAAVDRHGAVAVATDRVGAAGGHEGEESECRHEGGQFLQSLHRVLPRALRTKVSSRLFAFPSVWTVRH